MKEKICKIDGCLSNVKAKGFCSKHYGRFRKYKDPYFLKKLAKGSSPSERLEFMSKKDGDCIVYTGAKSRNGYGSFFYKGRYISAHRAAYMEKYGPIESGLHVLHKCDNPSCINVAHLFLGTHQDNMDDRNKKGRCNPARGESSNFSKLKESDVKKIRELSSLGVRPTELSRKFGVTTSNIWMITTKRTWVNV